MTRESNRDRIKRGKSPVGKPPYGYRYEDGLLTVVPEEALFVSAIFEEIDNGISLREITATLNVCMEIHRVGKFKKWNHVAIKRIRDKRAFYEGKCSMVDGHMVYTKKPIHLPILQPREN